MASPPVESRLSAVEQTLLELARSQERTQAQQELTQAQIDLIAGETRSFQAETRSFQAELRAMAVRQDRQWGELANRLGTLTEDIILPGIPTVFRALFGETGRVDLAIRVRRSHPVNPGRSEEYDAVVSRRDIVLIAESKSTLRPEHVEEFRDKVARSREFLPETAGKKVVGLLGSFVLDPSLVTAGERQGLIMVGLGTGLLQLLNSPGFVPRAF